MDKKKATANSKRELKRVMADLHKTDLKEPGMIILENYDFYWTKKDMAVFLARWLQGQSVTTIANVLRPHLHPTDAQAEVTLLAYHFHLQKKIPCNISVENGCK